MLEPTGLNRGQTKELLKKFKKLSKHDKLEYLINSEITTVKDALWNKGFTDHYLLIIANIVFTALDGRKYFDTQKEAVEAGIELKKEWIKQRDKS